MARIFAAIKCSVPYRESTVGDCPAPVIVEGLRAIGVVLARDGRRPQRKGPRRQNEPPPGGRQRQDRHLQEAVGVRRKGTVGPTPVVSIQGLIQSNAVSYETRL